MPSKTTIGAGATPRAGLRGLRAHVVALVAAALLPAFAVGAIAVAAAVDSYGRAFEDRLENTASALASAVSAEIEVYVAALSALATDPGLDGGHPDLPAFHGRARRVAADLGTRVFLVLPDGAIALHTEVPADADPQRDRPPLRSAEAVRRVFETGRPAVGDLLAGQVTGRHLVPVYVPVARDGRVAFAIGAAMESARLSRLLARQGFHDGVYASLLDRQGKVAARSAEPDRFIGRRVRTWMLEGTAAAEGGLLRGDNLGGRRITTAFRRVPRSSGWTVAVAAPDAIYWASLRRPLAALALGGLAALAVALTVAARIGGRVLGPVEWLTRKAEGVAASGGAAAIAPGGPPVTVAEFERLRAAVLRSHLILQERAAALAAGEARHRAVVDTAADAIVVHDQGGAVRSLNRAAEAAFGYTEAEAVGRDISMLVGEGRRSADRGSGAGCRLPAGPGREAVGRRKDGSLFPVDLAVGEWRDAGGERFATAIVRDITARKADEERRTLLAREVDHRAKNVLAAVQSVLRLSPRGDPDAFVAAVEARVAALARVHSLLAEGGWSDADLRALAERELAAYAAPCAATGRAAAVSLDGPRVPLAPAAAQPLAMVLHELATNAAKHGALRDRGGRVDLRWRAARRAGEDGTLRLVWAEKGGPRVAGAPARRGFGTRVIEATVRGQLGGTVERRWEAEGLVVEIVVPLTRATVADGAFAAVVVDPDHDPADSPRADAPRAPAAAEAAARSAA